MIPDTQRAAFETLENIDTKRNKVYNFIKSRNGATFFEIAEALKWTINRVTPRCNELVKYGLVVDSGQRKVNPMSGRNGIVWILKTPEQQINLL